MKRVYEGQCHCGAIHFRFEGEEIKEGIRCNCSICARKGALMSAQVIPEEELTIRAKDDALGLYQFGSGTAKHYFCRNCGIYTHHEAARFPDAYRVNLAASMNWKRWIFPTTYSMARICFSSRKYSLTTSRLEQYQN